MKYDFHNEFRMIISNDQKTLSISFKSRRSQMFFKIGVLRNFVTFTRKHLWLIYKKDIPTQVFSCKYYKTFKNTYSKEHLRTATSVVISIKLVIKYQASADLFLTKNTMWNGLYEEVLQIWFKYIFYYILVEIILTHFYGLTYRKQTKVLHFDRL